MPPRKKTANQYIGPERRVKMETRGMLTNPELGILEHQRHGEVRKARFGGYTGKPFKGRKKVFMAADEIDHQNLSTQRRNPIVAGHKISFFRDKRPIKKKP